MKFKKIGILLLCVLMVIGGIACSDNRENSKITMISGDGQSVSLLDYQVYYFVEINRVLSNYANPSTIGLDMTSNLKEQRCAFDESISWADYFSRNALSLAKEILASVIAAEQEGIVLNDEQNQNIEDMLKEIEDSAKSSNVSTADYLKEMYGPNVSLDDMRRIYTRYEIYSAYTQHTSDQLQISQEEMDAYYEAHREEIDTLTARVAPFPYTVGDEESKNEAKQKAESFKNSVVDEQTFADTFMASMTETQLINYSGTDITKTYNITKNSFGSDTESAEYMFDDNRQPGDMCIVDTGNIYLVMYYIEKDNKDYHTCNVRVITASGSTYVERQTEAERLLNEFKSAGSTEEKFIELANQFTADTTVAAGSGGLYEDVYKGFSTTEITEWCFDAQRQYGDVAIIKTSTGRGPGCNLLFYLSQGDNYRNMLLSEKIRTARMGEIMTGLIEKYHVVADETLIDTVTELAIQRDN